MTTPPSVATLPTSTPGPSVWPSKRATPKLRLGQASVVIDPADPRPGETVRIFGYGFGTRPAKVELTLFGAHNPGRYPCGIYDHDEAISRTSAM